MHGQNIEIYLCLCVCVSECPLHFLSTRLQVRPLNGFLQLIAQSTRIYARMCLLGVSMINNHIYGFNVPQNPNFGGLNMHFKPNMRKILEIDISPYLSEKSSDFDGILYTAADLELNERHVIKNEKKLHWTDSEFDRTYFLCL